MKAVVFEEHGGTEVLQYTDIPEPEPGPYEVLIEVKAAGANFNDIWARRGMPGMPRRAQMSLKLAPAAFTSISTS